MKTSQLSNDMQGFTTKGALLASYRRLLEAMQRLNFGKIENLEIRGGLPVFQPAPRIVRDVKIGAEDSARTEVENEDFLLKAPVIECFEHLKRLGNGRVALIEIRHGCPFRLLIEQPALEVPR
jgi:hypothetical protein